MLVACERFRIFALSWMRSLWSSTSCDIVVLNSELMKMERANVKAYQGREALHLRDRASEQESTEKIEACN